MILLYSKIATKFPSSSMTRAMAFSTSTSIQTRLIGPAAKLLLFHHNLEPSSIQKHSGPKKNLLKSDILRHIKNAKLTPTKRQSMHFKNLNNESKISIGIGTYETAKLSKTTTKHKKYVDIPLTNMRQIIAKRLSQSKNNIPHGYISAYVSADKIQQLKEKLSKKYNLNLSLDDFIVKACAQTLRNFPELNVQWKNDDRVEHNSTVDISIAVETPSGLITPILFGADRMGVDQISRKLRHLAEKASEGKLRPADEEFQGGNFTISNLAMFESVSNFTAIISPPQTAILAVGGLIDSLDAQNQMRNNSFYMTLCFDARAIQDLDAQKFIQNLQFSLTEPNVLLAGGMETSMWVEEAERNLDLEDQDQWDLAAIDEMGIKNIDYAIADSDAKNMAKFLR